MPSAIRTQIPEVRAARPAAGAAPAGWAAALHDSPRMQRQSQLLASLTGQPAQREVKQNSARWGKDQGKWYTTFDPLRYFDSAPLAQAHEEEVLRQHEDGWQAQAAKQAWEFKDATGRLTEHFNDGWGDAYGITNPQELQQAILDAVGPDERDTEEIGDDKVIDLGNCLHDGEHVSRPCSIRYNVTGLVTVKYGSVTRQTVFRSVYHCGPSN